MCISVFVYFGVLVSAIYSVKFSTKHVATCYQVNDLLTPCPQSNHRGARDPAVAQQRQHAQLLPQRGGRHLPGGRVVEAQHVLQLRVSGRLHQLLLRDVPAGGLRPARAQEGAVLPLLPGYVGTGLGI